MLTVIVIACYAIAGRCGYKQKRSLPNIGRLHGSKCAENYMSNFIFPCCHYRGSIVSLLQILVMVAAS